MAFVLRVIVIVAATLAAGTGAVVFTISASVVLPGIAAVVADRLVVWSVATRMLDSSSS